MKYGREEAYEGEKEEKKEGKEGGRKERRERRRKQGRERRIWLKEKTMEESCGNKIGPRIGGTGPDGSHRS